MNENIQNDKFVPLTASHGNVDGEIAHLRDTYLNSEREYYVYLLGFDCILERMRELIEYTPDALYKEAIDRINALENGEVETFYNQSENVSEKGHMNNLERIEGEIAMLLGAIRDKALIKELILKMDIEQEEAHSRVRGR